jgi:membrane fusion protein, multidrug efflux system
LFQPLSPRTSVVLLLALATACSRDTGTTSASANAPPAQAVRTTQATVADVPLEIAAIGNVEASATIEVKARVTSPVTKVHFTEGQDVREGQLLFELDPEPFQRQLAEIEANIARDVANAKQAEANIARDQANSKNIDSIAKRTVQLQKEGIFSREQADQSMTNADAAKAAVDAGRAAVESAKAAERANRARLQETRLSLEYTKIYAPISGRAGVIATKQGSLAKQHDNTLVTLLQSAPVDVSFSVPENLLPQIRKYQSEKPMTIIAVTSDRSTTGVLSFIDSAVDTTTGAIRLKALFANTDRLLWPGQFVNVRARLDMEQQRVLVSAQAVQTGPRGKFVWALNPADNTVSIRDVAVLRLYTPAGKTEQAVIGSGLKAGENVIIEGQKRLAPNTKVRILPPN